MHQTICFLLLSFLWASTHAQSFGYSLPKGAKKLEIPFDRYGHFIVVPVTINRMIPLKFVLDSGAKHTIVLKKDYTDILGIPYGREFTLTGADRKTKLNAKLLANVKLTMDEVQARNQALLVLDEDYLQFDQFVGSEIHGILGSDLFERFVVKVDYERKVLTLYEPAAFKPPGGKYVPVPISIDGSKPYIDVPIYLTREDSTSATLLLDNGAGFAVLLYHKEADSIRIDGKVIAGNIGMGLGGYLRGYLGRIDGLRIDRFEFSNVVTNFQILDDSSTTDDASNKGGIIGANILERFVYIFNYEKRMMYIKPVRNYNKAFKYDLSGLFILASGDQLNNFVVDQVMKNSPADRAGILAGDIIRKINGKRDKFTSLQEITDKLQSREGRKIRLTIERNGTFVKKQFYLEKIL